MGQALRVVDTVVNHRVYTVALGAKRNDSLRRQWSRRIGISDITTIGCDRPMISKLGHSPLSLPHCSL
jgi:hypothetical protein